ncbi:VCBS repeat-containing protein [Shewanella corallii]|uniref:VCBS repeat-containing protein n=1 Tax=Shewanella corallii TaxID=560080 RepID=A0ABT0N9W2_9GAMM|nr:VCBS repeat-containing protein [Shewanella corallii]MCL2915137.1 VCBS repeat-containing protein [Shewanella corallii]
MSFMPLLPLVVSLLLLISAMSHADDGIDFYEQTLKVPFKLTHKVVPVELLNNPGKELMVLGVDELQQKWLALFFQRDPNAPGTYSLLGKVKIPPNFYRFDIHEPDNDRQGQVFFLSNDTLYQFRPEHFLGIPAEDKLFEPVAEVDSLSLKSRVPFLTRGGLVHQLDKNPWPELVVQGLNGVTVLSNVGGRKGLVTHTLPVTPDMLLYSNGARYMQARLYPVDANFDGLKDLLKVGEGDMEVFWQRLDGSFTELPDYLPVSQPINGLEWWFHRDAWGEDPDQSNMVYRFVEHIDDVNADGISDMVVRYAKSSGVLDRVNDYEIYYGRRNKEGKLSFAREADTVISGEGTLTGFEFEDLDGDERLEVLVAGFDIGVSQIISALLAGSIDVDVYLFRLDNEDKFSKRPGFEETVELSFSLSSGQTGEPVILLADVNGDGYKELMLSADEDSLQIFPGVAGTTMFSSRSKEVKLPLPDSGDYVVTDDINGDDREDIVFSYSREASDDKQSSFVVLIATPKV